MKDGQMPEEQDEKGEYAEFVPVFPRYDFRSI